MSKDKNAKSTIIVCLIGAIVLMSMLDVFSGMGTFIRYQRSNNTW